MTVIDKIANQVKNTLNQEVEIVGVKTTTGIIILRIIVYSLTLGWISFYPLYLLTVHMHVEGFFSYDIFVNGIFGINAFFIFVLVMIILAGFYCWGFIPVMRGTRAHAVKWLLVPVCIFVSLATHIFLINGSIRIENFAIVFWVSGAGFLSAITFTSYVDEPISKAINNWAGPLIFVVISASVPLISKEGVSEAVKLGLKSFGVGGNRVAHVKRISTDEVLLSGKLLLLTPNYIYIRKGEKGYQSISRSNESYIDVE